MPYFLAQKSGMTVIFLDSTTMGIKIGVQWLDRPTVTFLCQFQELAQALHVYNDIYRDRNLIVISSLLIRNFISVNTMCVVMMNFILLFTAA